MRRKEECGAFGEEEREPQGQLPPSDRGRVELAGACGRAAKTPESPPRRRPARHARAPSLGRGPQPWSLLVWDQGAISEGSQVEPRPEFFRKLNVCLTWQLCYRWGTGIKKEKTEVEGVIDLQVLTV